LEPREVTVEGDDLRAVLERKRGEVGVVDEIRSRPDAAEQPTQKAQVARARVDDDRGGLVEPELDDAGRLVERERSRERAGPACSATGRRAARPPPTLRVDRFAVAGG